MGRDVNETAPGTQISVSPRSIYGNEQRKGQVPIESPTEQPGRSPKSNKAPMVNVSPPSYAFIGPPEDTPPEARPQTLQVSQEDDTKEEETETDVPEVPSFDRQTLMYTALGAVTVIGLSYFLLT